MFVLLRKTALTGKKPLKMLFGKNAAPVKLAFRVVGNPTIDEDADEATVDVPAARLSNPKALSEHDRTTSETRSQTAL